VGIEAEDGGQTAPGQPSAGYGQRRVGGAVPKAGRLFARIHVDAPVVRRGIAIREDGWIILSLDRHPPLRAFHAVWHNIADDLDFHSVDVEQVAQKRRTTARDECQTLHRATGFEFAIA
jgi:hypothetical protein